jgi:DNA mismatch endonuclease (patch repair protein)
MIQAGNRKPRKAGHRAWAAGNGRVPGVHRGDIMSPATRSALMARIRGKHTTPERIMFVALRRSGLHFRTHASDLPGRPDIVLRRRRIAVFIDGDFWHGWRLPLWQHKLSPAWRSKIQATRMRDARNFRRLRRAGWIVLRLWEHQIERAPARCVERILSVVAQTDADRVAVN